MAVTGSGSTLEILDQVNLSPTPAQSTSTVCLVVATRRYRPRMTETDMSRCSTLDLDRVKSGGSVCVGIMMKAFHHFMINFPDKIEEECVSIISEQQHFHNWT